MSRYVEYNPEQAWLLPPSVREELGEQHLAIFVHELIEHIPVLLSAAVSSTTLWVLSLIDMSLVANLILIVVLAGYKNFVSRMVAQDHPDWPSWVGAIDFSGTKLKLIGSIVAISAISLLRAFMTLVEPFAWQ